MPESDEKNEGFTEELKGRVEPVLAQRVEDWAKGHKRSKSFVVRQAVEEFLERNPLPPDDSKQTEWAINGNGNGKG